MENKEICEICKKEITKNQLKGTREIGYTGDGAGVAGESFHVRCERPMTDEEYENTLQNILKRSEEIDRMFGKKTEKKGD